VVFPLSPLSLSPSVVLPARAAWLASQLSSVESFIVLRRLEGGGCWRLPLGRVFVVSLCLSDGSVHLSGHW
jgi:hypothetical protein